MIKQINRITCFMLLLIVSMASSETKKAMTIVDLINVPSLGDPQPVSYTHLRAHET